jgi:hypothetical protein
VNDDDITEGTPATIKLTAVGRENGGRHRSAMLIQVIERPGLVVDVLRAGDIRVDPRCSFFDRVPAPSRVVRVCVRDESTGIVHKFYRRAATSTLLLFDVDGSAQWEGIDEDWPDGIETRGLIVGRWPEGRDAV